MWPLCMLLVDDNPAFLESAARFLAADERIRIVGRAGSGREALEQAARLRPDLVLMDVSMPGMNGVDATRRLKAQPNAPLVVIVSLHDSAEGRCAAESAQADGFVAKAQFCVELPPLIDQLVARPCAH